MSTGNPLFSFDELLRPVRSTFLTVLCVLTFIGSGFGLLGTIPMLAGYEKFNQKFQKNLTPEKIAEQRERLKKQNGTDGRLGLKMLDSMEQLADRKKMLTKTGIDILSFLLCIGGAVLMWRLKSKGYFIYLAGVLLWMSSSVMVYGFGMFVAALESGIKLFIGLLFIILYAMNLKDIRAAEARAT